MVIILGNLGWWKESPCHMSLISEFLSMSEVQMWRLDPCKFLSIVCVSVYVVTRKTLYVRISSCIDLTSKPRHKVLSSWLTSCSSVAEKYVYSDSRTDSTCWYNIVKVLCRCPSARIGVQHKPLHVCGWSWKKHFEICPISETLICLLLRSANNTHNCHVFKVKKYIV